MISRDCGGILSGKSTWNSTTRSPRWDGLLGRGKPSPLSRRTAPGLMTSLQGRGIILLSSVGTLTVQPQRAWTQKWKDKVSPCVDLVNIEALSQSLWSGLLLSGMKWATHTHAHKNQSCGWSSKVSSYITDKCGAPLFYLFFYFRKLNDLLYYATHRLNRC